MNPWSDFNRGQKSENSSSTHTVETRSPNVRKRVGSIERDSCCPNFEVGVLTLSSAGSYIDAEINGYGNGPESHRHSVYHCCFADAQLMSADAGPGRTGLIFNV